MARTEPIGKLRHRVEVQEVRQVPNTFGEPVDTWETVATRWAEVRINFVAGYGVAADVPKHIKQAVKLLVGHWYEQREPVAVGTITKAMEFALESLLGMAWTGEYV